MIVITLDTAVQFRKAKFNHTFIHYLLHAFGLREDVRVSGENIQGSSQEPPGCDASVLTTDHYTTVTNYSICFKNVDDESIIRKKNIKSILKLYFSKAESNTRMFDEAQMPFWYNSPIYLGLGLAPTFEPRGCVYVSSQSQTGDFSHVSHVCNTLHDKSE